MGADARRGRGDAPPRTTAGREGLPFCGELEQVADHGPGETTIEEAKARVLHISVPRQAPSAELSYSQKLIS